MSVNTYQSADDYYWERRWRDRLEDERCGRGRGRRGFAWGAFFFGVLLGAIIF
ncbi:MAG: hypothetical protein AAF224_04845 [Pseudomonadota bacterium]